MIAHVLKTIKGSETPCFKVFFKCHGNFNLLYNCYLTLFLFLALVPTAKVSAHILQVISHKTTNLLTKMLSTIIDTQNTKSHIQENRHTVVAFLNLN